MQISFTFVIYLRTRFTMPNSIDSWVIIILKRNIDVCSGIFVFSHKNKSSKGRGLSCYCPFYDVKKF